MRDFFLLFMITAAIVIAAAIPLAYISVRRIRNPRRHRRRMLRELKSELAAFGAQLHGDPEMKSLLSRTAEALDAIDADAVGKAKPSDIYLLANSLRRLRQPDALDRKTMSATLMQLHETAELYSTLESKR